MSATQDIPVGLCQCGCGKPTPLAKVNDATNGKVKGQPMRYVVGHSDRTWRIAPESWREEDLGYTTPCWHWTGSISPEGYGRWGGKSHQYAHRRMYQQHHGPIPAGMQIDHLCRNRACVNPAHLEPVIAAVNVQRSRSAKLTAEDVIAIRASTLPQQVLADAYGVNSSTIYRICSRERWRNVA